MIPKHIKEIGQRTIVPLKLKVRDRIYGGFTDLHTKSYEAILQGNGFGLSEAKTSIDIVHKIRNSEPLGLKGDYHPFCKL